ncbi:HAD-IA family hydrolase [Abyssibius alkaniclasticus]|uniref:HAD-IA family hydrolase n=1 Tax=Abyssibius alkaniclasticus TaxID=2881234 RepID=UPI002364744B|nr:HAD-IA family hydrolase [Abyssibius alkaniclasticus]UPH71869.1 HAD-IA family hydrolase [Abyssibius alkaniclasticus]
MTPPKAVIFDIGNVLIRWQPEAYYDRHFGVARRKALFGAVDLHAMNEDIDAGAPFLATVQAWAARHPDWAAEIMLWHDDWAGLAAPLIEGSWNILHRLRAAGVPVFALSNIGDDTTTLAESGPYPQLAAFDRRYISGRMGVTKPDPRIYEMVQADCGLAGPDLYFIDDRAENIATAAALGWRIHLFTAPDRLAADLRVQGLPL